MRCTVLCFVCALMHTQFHRTFFVDDVFGDFRRNVNYALELLWCFGALFLLARKK